MSCTRVFKPQGGFVPIVMSLVCAKKYARKETLTAGLLLPSEFG